MIRPLLLTTTLWPALFRGDVVYAYTSQKLESRRFSGPTRGEEQSFYRTQYLGIGYARNFPVSFSATNFRAGIPHPVLSYRYFLRNHWAVGISGQFKFLTEKATGDELVLTTLAQESYYVYRIYYPLSFMAGGRLMYLNPVRKGMFPLQRHKDYDLEIGISAAIGLMYGLTKESLLELKLERWRGTKTMRLHGTEINIGIAFSLPQ